MDFLQYKRLLTAETLRAQRKEQRILTTETDGFPRTKSARTRHWRL